MKKTIMIAIVCSLVLGFTATSASASITPLTVGGGYYVGFFNQPEPSGEAAEAGYINNLITVGAGLSSTIGGRLYDRAGSTLTGLTATDATGAENVGGPYTSIGVTGFAYLLGKYDGPNWGAYVWLVPAGTYSIPLNPPGRTDYGISHYAVFGGTPPQEVPDGGMTLMLLGGALVGLAALRRRFNA